MAQAATQDLGIAYLPKKVAHPWIARGAVVPVLDDWCPANPDLFLYYPRHRYIPLGLRAFIGVLKELAP